MQDTGYLKITRHLLKVTFEKWVVFVLFDLYTTFTKPFHQLIQPIISRNLHPKCTEKPSSTVGKTVSCQKSSRVEVQNTKNVHTKKHVFFWNSLPIYVFVFLLMLTSCFPVFLNKKKSTESVNTYDLQGVTKSAQTVASFYSVWKENHSLHLGFLHIAWKKSS